MTRSAYYHLQEGDSLELMAALPAESISAIVCDPPYGLKFMEKDFDDLGDGAAQREWHKRWAVEALRVLSPGGHLLAFGGSRTSHHLASGIEEAGFEIRDSIIFLYGSGFPKSRDLGGGWGTNLKPAHEPICVARKPISERTIAANVLKHGTGGLNIDGGRVEGAPWTWGTQTDIRGGGYGSKRPSDGHVFARNVQSNPKGRWPANVIHDGSEAVEAIFPLTGKSNASRYFYCAKPSKKEREAGCEKLAKGQQDPSRKEGSPGGDNPRNRGTKQRGNTHPTVKSLALMRYLVRLVTPPGGLVLDPFAGSGTTGVACIEEGFDFLLMEREPEYIPIIQGRVSAAFRRSRAI